MNTPIKSLAALALVAAGLLGAGAAQARTDIHWSISIPGPIGVAVGNAPVYAAPVYAPAPVYAAPVYVAPAPVVVRPAPVYYGRPAPVVGHRHGGWGDADRDGIPNRYDRVYNPRWDRDGDGVPNRWDRHDGRRGR